MIARRGGTSFSSWGTACVLGGTDDSGFPKLWLLNTMKPLLPHCQTQTVFRVHYQEHRRASLWKSCGCSTSSPMAFTFQGAREVLGALRGVKLWDVDWGKSKASVRAEMVTREGPGESRGLHRMRWQPRKAVLFQMKTCTITQLVTVSFSSGEIAPGTLIEPQQWSQIYFLEQKPGALLPQNGTSLTSWDSSHFQRKLKLWGIVWGCALKSVDNLSAHHWWTLLRVTASKICKDYWKT